MKFLGALLVSLLFTTSIIASNGKTVSSIEATTQKKAGQIVYNCGNTPCEGYKKAYYNNGQLQISGTFENGIAIDTIKEYNVTGQMMRLFCPNTENGFEKQFYPNGQVKRVFENKTNRCTYYYDNGTKWLSYTYNAGFRSNITQYYRNGEVRLEQKGNTQYTYYTNGKLAQKCKRSEINKMNRVFTDNDVHFYNYQFEAYNEAGKKVTKASFQATEMDFKNGFPIAISDVDDKDFKEIVYFDETGHPVKKVEYQFTSNSRYKKVDYVYEFGKWHAFESNSVLIDKKQTK